jgi:ABC-2 type transport system permease protein
MMLFYKAWRESRTRFLLASLVLVVVCAAFLLRSAQSGFAPPEHPGLRYSVVVWATFYGNTSPMLFSVFALVLSLGGLHRERAAGTAGFTLALPVSRVLLLVVRIATGILELAVVAVLPALIIPALSPAMLHQSYPVTQALGFAVLFMTWGVIWFAIGILWSVVFAGEYTAVALTLLTPFAYMIVYSKISLGGRLFPSANPFAFMSGMDIVAKPGWMFLGPLPWTAIATFAGVATTLLIASALITRRQSF